MNLRSLIFFFSSLLILFCTNPSLHSFKDSILAKTTGTYFDYLFFSLIIYKPIFGGNYPRYYIGILSNWMPLVFPVNLSAFMCKCKNGICLLGECVCFLGFKGKSCNRKRRDFKSLWSFLIKPILLKCTELSNSVMAPLCPFSISGLYLYENLDCFFGIPLSIFPPFFSYIVAPYANLSSKLCFQDIYLIAASISFIYAKLVQFGVVGRTAMFDLSWYNFWERRMFLPLFLSQFYHPQTLHFLSSIYSFYSLAPLGQQYLGHDRFVAYLICLSICSNMASICFASRTGRRMKFFYGLMNIVIGLEFLLLYFAVDRKAVFREVIMPNSAVRLFLSDFDVGGILAAALISYFAYYLNEFPLSFWAN